MPDKYARFQVEGTELLKWLDDEGSGVVPINRVLSQRCKGGAKSTQFALSWAILNGYCALGRDHRERWVIGINGRGQAFAREE